MRSVIGDMSTMMMICDWISETAVVCDWLLGTMRLRAILELKKRF